MGMMNNPHFRVKMTPRSGANGELNLACEHPTKQGSEPGGWMEREVAGVRDAEAKALAAELEAKSAVDESKLRIYSLEEVQPTPSFCSSSMIWALLESCCQGTAYRYSAPGCRAGGEERCGQEQVAHVFPQRGAGLCQIVSSF